MLRTRIISALILLPVIILLVYIGRLAWLAATMIIGVLAWQEMTGLLRRSGFTIYLSLGFVFVLAAIAEAYISAIAILPFDLLRPLLAGLIILSLIWALYLRGDHPTTDWAMTVASSLYLGVMLSYFVALRERPDGLWWVYLAMAVTWASDVGAFFVGRSFGKHPWWPRLSPKKTWEGLAGGTVAALIVAVILGMWWLDLRPWLGLLLGALIAVLAPLGDLSESLLKRMAQTKDSGSLIPGHGGVLDRIDSLMFVFPVVTYFALIVSGP